MSESKVPGDSTSSDSDDSHSSQPGLPGSPAPQSTSQASSLAAAAPAARPSCHSRAAVSTGGHKGRQSGSQPAPSTSSLQGDSDTAMQSLNTAEEGVSLRHASPTWPTGSRAAARPTSQDTDTESSHAPSPSSASARSGGTVGSGDGVPSGSLTPRPPTQEASSRQESPRTSYPEENFPRVARTPSPYPATRTPGRYPFLSNYRSPGLSPLAKEGSTETAPGALESLDIFPGIRLHVGARRKIFFELTGPTPSTSQASSPPPAARGEAPASVGPVGVVPPHSDHSAPASASRAACSRAVPAVAAHSSAGTQAGPGSRKRVQPHVSPTAPGQEEPSREQPQPKRSRTASTGPRPESLASQTSGEAASESSSSASSPEMSAAFLSTNEDSETSETESESSYEDF